MPNLCDYRVLRIVHGYEKGGVAGSCRKLRNISEIKKKIFQDFSDMSRNVVSNQPIGKPKKLEVKMC